MDEVATGRPGDSGPSAQADPVTGFVVELERVADRLSDPASETPCLLYAYCHGKDYGKRRLERETAQNLCDRTWFGDVE